MERITYEIDDLMTPIPGSQDGVGKDESLSNEYDEIRSARIAEDPQLSMGIWERDLKKANWPLVESLTIDVLKNKSKDLLAVSWLMESLVNMDGFNGALKSFQILDKFAQSFALSCFPRTDDGASDDEQKQHILNKLIDNISIKLSLTPIVDAFTLYDYEYAGDIKIKIKQDPESEKSIMDVFNNEGRPEQEKIQNAIKSSTNMSDVLSILQYTNQAIAAASDIINQSYNNTISFSKCTNTISKIINIINTFRTKEETISGELQVVQEEEEINDRDAVYSELGKLATQLKKIEKHSPTPYILDLLVSWKDKTLYQIIDDMHTSNTESNKLLKFLLSQ